MCYGYINKYKYTNTYNTIQIDVLQIYKQVQIIYKYNQKMCNRYMNKYKQFDKMIFRDSDQRALKDFI